MWIGPLWMPSVSGQLAYEFKTTVAPSSISEAQMAKQKSEGRIQALRQPWDVVPESVAEAYTQRGQMPSVKEKIGRIIDIKA